MKKIVLTLLILHSTFYIQAQQRWPIAKANEWQTKQGWLVGCNYIPANAINQLEMWQETFDPATIDKELGWAENLGFNVLRVFLHNLPWQENPKKFHTRINTFLEICHKHKIKVMFVFFDDCWGGNPQTGKQPDPVPGLHNSGWVQSPGYAQVMDSIQAWPIMEKYVKDILSTYANDSRVVIWDLYNEPGNEGHFTESLPLLKKVFQWARNVNPSQPLTAGVWQMSKMEYRELTNFQLYNSDIITYHNYGSYEDAKKDISKYKSYGRPVLCSEYLARGYNNNFEIHLPLMKQENVGAVNWGFVYGKTQTVFPWSTPLNSKEPEVWHHDILRPDGTPFSSKETDLIKKLTGKK
jgi:hypothetical protein